MPPTGASSRTLSFRRALAAEWTKLITVRSTLWTALCGLVVSLGLGVGLSMAMTASYSSMSSADKASFDPTSHALSGLNLSTLAFAVLGVMAITSEYSTGMIRTSLAAMPRRVHLLGAKALVLAAVVLVIGEIISFGSFFTSQAVFSAEDIETTLGAPGVLRAVASSGALMALIALLGLAVGTLVRHVAGAITIMLGVLFVAPVITMFVPGTAGESIGKFLPTGLTEAVVSVVPAERYLTPGTGFLIYCLYALALLVFAAYRLRKTDA
ncbi:ABC transporter permease subunit [Streptomyces niveus]|uniref:ABC transporter permease subunit n=2 Tax=Streptomyces niveus TaxID=193462 RepID=UPI0036C0EBE7